jgi:uncharacterized protein (DUF2062 family)
MMSRWLESGKQRVAQWLRQGISPQRLALTLALGFAIGCFPVVGVPTAACAVVALALKLNLPAIQAANYVAMPLQVALIVPFVRLGGWLFAGSSSGALTAGSNLPVMTHFVSMTGGALVAWLVFAGPTVALMTLALTIVFRRIPALAAEAGD